MRYLSCCKSITCQYPPFVIEFIQDLLREDYTPTTKWLGNFEEEIPVRDIFFHIDGKKYYYYGLKMWFGLSLMHWDCVPLSWNCYITYHVQMRSTVRTLCPQIAHHELLLCNCSMFAIVLQIVVSSEEICLLDLSFQIAYLLWLVRLFGLRNSSWAQLHFDVNNLDLRKGGNLENKYEWSVESIDSFCKGRLIGGTVPSFLDLPLRHLSSNQHLTQVWSYQHHVLSRRPSPLSIACTPNSKRTALERSKRFHSRSFGNDSRPDIRYEFYASISAMFLWAASRVSGACWSVNASGPVPSGI